jgi:hypothetical protein
MHRQEVAEVKEATRATRPGREVSKVALCAARHAAWQGLYRAQGTARTRQMVWVDFLCGQCFRIAGSIHCETDLCKAKVENLGMATVGDEDVCWLDVSVNDSLRVSSAQPVCHAKRLAGSAEEHEARGHLVDASGHGESSGRTPFDNPASVGPQVGTHACRFRDTSAKRSN